jgi:hypothetical protein
VEAEAEADDAALPDALADVEGAPCGPPGGGCRAPPPAHAPTVTIAIAESARSFIRASYARVPRSERTGVRGGVRRSLARDVGEGFEAAKETGSEIEEDAFAERHVRFLIDTSVAVS